MRDREWRREGRKSLIRTRFVIRCLNYWIDRRSVRPALLGKIQDLEIAKVMEPMHLKTLQVLTAKVNFIQVIV